MIYNFETNATVFQYHHVTSGNDSEQFGIKSLIIRAAASGPVTI